MIFIEFTYHFCKRIVFQFFYGFSNDLYHEFNLINCYDDADLHGVRVGGRAGGRGSGGLEHQHQDHRPGGVGWTLRQ